MTKYVIYKNSRLPYVVSYDGYSWDGAGIRNLRKDIYEDKNEALRIAKMLTEFNVTGFSVAKAYERK